jgi:O-acetyl-ADP-ribose deacetylase (regulator of RNase III)
MKQQIKFGNILTLKEGILIHGCNAQGVMGSGIASGMRVQYPACYEAYVDFIEFNRRKSVASLGKVCFYQDDKLTVANAITQEHFGKDKRQYVSYSAIQSVFKQVAAEAEQTDQVINYPLIGAGLGGGDWSIISTIIDNVFEDHPTVCRTLWIYE